MIEVKIYMKRSYEMNEEENPFNSFLCFFFASYLKNTKQDGSNDSTINFDLLLENMDYG